MHDTPLWCTSILTRFRHSRPCLLLGPLFPVCNPGLCFLLAIGHIRGHSAACRAWSTPTGESAGCCPTGNGDNIKHAAALSDSKHDSSIICNSDQTDAGSSPYGRVPAVDKAKSISNRLRQYALFQRIAWRFKASCRAGNGTQISASGSWGLIRSSQAASPYGLENAFQTSPCFTAQL